MSYNYLFKCIIVGDTGVGKTCLLTRFIEKRFNGNNGFTVGVEFFSKIIAVRDKKIKIQIWDTSGQEAFTAITRLYYKDCAIALFVFDLNIHKTFQHLKKWLKAVKSECGEKVVFVIVGNKSDLPSDIDNTEIDSFVAKHELLYLETSALTSNDISKIFVKASEEVLFGVETGKIAITELNGVRGGSTFFQEDDKKRGCCDDNSGTLEDTCCDLM